MTKTAILLPYPAQSEQIIQLAEAFPSLEIMCVEHAHTDTVVQMAVELKEKGCELIIARGLHAHLLRESIIMPIVDMKVTTQELGMVILELKKQVESSCPKIGLVGYHNMFGDTAHFKDLFDVELRKYTEIVNREIEVHVDQAYRDGCEAIIGGDVACGRASELGLPSYKIPAGMESLSNALRNASMVSYAIEMSKTNNAEIDVMLNNTFTGIMQVDNDSVIRRINRTGGDFLERYLGDPVGKRVTQVIPSLRRKALDDALIDGKEAYSIFANSRNMEIVVNIAPIRIDNRIQGAVLTFQE